MPIIFSFEQEICKGEVFLTVLLQKPDRSPVLFTDLAMFEKEIFALLRKYRAKETGVKLGSPEEKKLCYDRIRLPPSSSFEIISLLATKGYLSYKGKSLFFNPLDRATGSIEAEAVGEGIYISGFLTLLGKKVSCSELDFLLISEDTVWGIAGRSLFTLPEEILDLPWSLCYPEPTLFEGKEKQSFLRKYRDDPRIVQKGDDFPLSQEEVLLPVYPCLHLRDPYGAFADLLMEYEGKTVDFHDPCRFPGRNIAGEKGWETDLRETGFAPKFSETARYYCPMDRVVKSISFLLELGWKILDKGGKRLQRTSGSDLHCEAKGEILAVKGKVSFGEHTADIQDVAGAFLRRERFLSLSSDSVAWLGDDPDYEFIKELHPEEVHASGCLFTKKQYGFLRDRFPETETVLLKASGYCEDREEFSGTLRPYQQEGAEKLRFWYQNRFSGLLADDMGLGKTVQTLAFLSSLRVQKPILIVAPTSLVFNWKEEWDRFLQGKLLHVHQGPGRKDLAFLQGCPAILTSYSYLRIDAALFSRLDLGYVVLDEAQTIKNPGSLIARSCFALRSEARLCLTGTPVENKMEDLWSLFRFLEPDLLGKREEFAAEVGASGLDPRYRDRLRKQIAPFILRRRKEEVLTDLPEKIEQIVRVDFSEEQRALYEAYLIKSKQGVLQKVARDGVSSHRVEILEAILRLRQICSDPRLVDGSFAFESAKTEAVLSDILEVAEGGKKVLVYSQFTTMLGIVRKRLEELSVPYVYLDGSTTDRSGPVDRFQNDPSVPVFLISLKAGGVGLNLTAADYVFILDPWWNDAVERQAVDRAHRIGRKGCVVAKRYVCRDTLEEKMLMLKEHKRSLADAVLDFDGSDFRSEEDLLTLFDP